MESIFAKIPDLGDKIIRELDNKSLLRCKEVQRSWYNFINEEKTLWLRMIQNYIGNDNKFLTAWRKVLTKTTIDFVAQIAFATKQSRSNVFLVQTVSPISVAVIDGSLDLYKEMMVKLSGMNQKDIFGEESPLFLAADIGHYDICKLVIANMVDKNPARHDGVSPLYMAAQNGHYKICKLIISNVDDKNPAMYDGVTPLFIAADQGHYEICKLIISNVDEKNPASYDGITPLYVAAEKGHYDICKLIITTVDDKNPARHDGYTPLYVAAKKGNYEIFKLIFETLGNNNKNSTTNSGWTPLHIAAKYGHLKICKMILEELDNKNPAMDDGLTPLALASMNGHLEVKNFQWKLYIHMMNIANSFTPTPQEQVL